jgi:hypothetical protein
LNRDCRLHRAGSLDDLRLRLPGPAAGLPGLHGLTLFEQCFTRERGANRACRLIVDHHHVVGGIQT